jgi:phosphoglycerate dehydrogenase-like enzyme
MSPFRVGITDDFAPGNLIGGWIDDPVRRLLAPLPELEWEFIPSSGGLISPESVADYDAVITSEPKWTAESFRDLRRLMLVAYWGIGVDGIDLSAAADADVAVTNSPSAGNHASVAESALTFVLSLSKHLLAKDRLTKQGQASAAQALPGSLIRGRTIGTIGFGATARAFAQMVGALGPARLLAYDPYVTPEVAQQAGAELADLTDVMRESDYLVVMCTLSDQTRGLVSAELLSLMKPTAYLVNTARGPIVDQRALLGKVRDGSIAGAALDVTDPEPPEKGDEVLQFENVITTGHAIAWTLESLQGACEEPCLAVATAYRGDVPGTVVNPTVLRKPGFRAKLARRVPDGPRDTGPP